VVDDGAERWKIVVVEERVRRRGGVEENVQRAQGGLWWRLARVREGDVRVSLIKVTPFLNPHFNFTKCFLFFILFYFIYWRKSGIFCGQL
jgi:hypothetical protein